MPSPYIYPEPESVQRFLANDNSEHRTREEAIARSVQNDLESAFARSRRDVFTPSEIVRHLQRIERDNPDLIREFLNVCTT